MVATALEVFSRERDKDPLSRPFAKGYGWWPLMISTFFKRSSTGSRVLWAHWFAARVEDS